MGRDIRMRVRVNARGVKKKKEKRRREKRGRAGWERRSSSGGSARSRWRVETAPILTVSLG